jgi:pyridoxal phosphate enzyme (YggS family)
MTRTEELADNLKQINERIAQACQKSGRSDSEVTLIAVTKTYPPLDVDLLASLGVKNVGENKDQEAREKHLAVKSQLNWHFVGQLQTNKVKSVVKYADYIHSVDRIRLATEIDKCSATVSKKMKVFIQVDLGGDDPNRGGVVGEQLFDFAAAVSALPNLNLVGLMAVAPLGQAPTAAFERLSQIRAEFVKTYPQASDLSAGMSEDFEEAISFGATHLRIGALLLGVRPSLL